MNGIQYWKVFLFCIIAAISNVALGYLSGMAGIPLYLDTVFTVAVCFSAGLLPALLTGILLTQLGFIFLYKYILGVSLKFYLAGLIGYLFLICIVIEVLLVWFFHKKMKAREAAFLAKPSVYTFTGVASYLLVIVAIDCILLSISGGIIGFAITQFREPGSTFPEDTFLLGLLRNNVPFWAASILSRIPINIIDRFIVIFGGYFISRLFIKLASSRGQDTPKLAETKKN